MSLISETTMTQSATTVFVDDAAVITKKMPTMAQTDNLPITCQSIPDFLMKPYKVSAVTWTVSSPSETQLFNIEPSSYLRSGGNSYWVNKLEGFSLIKGTVCLRVTLNANPFQSGRLILSFIPGVREISAVDSSYPSKFLTLPGLTMLPNMEIDVHDSAVVFKIPYVTPYQFFDLVNNVGTWGRFYLYVLSPLVTGAGGETSVDITTYLWFEDVELAAPLVPQGTSGKSRSKLSKSYTSQEQVPGGGLISNMLNVGADVADAISSVPILTEIAKPASWLLRGLSGVASLFGWSKPASAVVPQLIMSNANRYSACMEGTDTSVTIANIPDNEVSISCCNSLTNEDEMSLAFLKRKEAFWGAVSWTTSDIAGTALNNYPVSPSTLYMTKTKVVAGHTMTYGVGPPIWYLSRYFSHWRGGIKMHIKIPKTDFHTGRLEITWSPGVNVATTPTLITSELALREIIDLKTGNEFVLDLPFLIPSNFLLISEYSGYVTIRVLNELRCPETASGTIQLLIYYSACEDFEFNGLASYNTLTQPFSLQSGCVVDDVVANADCGDVSLRYDHESFGEAIHSVKSMLARYTPVVKYATENFTGYNLFLYPWLNSIISLNASTGAVVIPEFMECHTQLRSMYFLYKGSYRVGLQPNGNAGFIAAANLPYQRITNPTRFSNGVDYANGTGSNFTTTLYTNRIGSAVACPSVDSTRPFFTQIPYYAKTKASYVLSSDTGTLVSEPSQPVSGLNVSSLAASLVTVGITIAAGDDFVLSYFLGCPPLPISYA